MNNALFANTNGLIAYVDTALDLSAKNGLTLVYSGAGTDADLSAGGLVVSTSSSVPATHIVLDGVPAGRQNSIGVIGAIPPVRLYCSGTVTKHNRVMQDAAGGILNSTGSGNARVDIGVALESGIAGSYVRVATFTPAIGS